MGKVLKDVPDDRLRAYVVWDPIFGGDFDGESRKLSNKFGDKRVRYFKDPKSFAGNLWERVLQTKRGIAWDVYLLYGADAEWGDEPPPPAFWMHQLNGVTKAPRLHAGTFTEELKGMLSKLEPISTQERKQAGKGKERMKIEVLYFASCPTAKDAITNLKAVLKERNIRADVKLIAVETEEKAEKLGFQGSPSIRVNGKDLEGRDEGYAFSCRMYDDEGKMRPVPSKALISKKLDALRR